jgi:hypothetical protein
MQTSLRVSTKFWLGAFIPAIGLALVVAAALATGHDKAEAPMLLFFASLVAVPGVLLLNCWVLFVAWSSGIRMLAAACAIPAVVGLGSLLVVHGTGRWQEAGIAILLPFLMVPITYARTVGAVWVLLLLVVLLVAGAVQRARERGRPTSGESSDA